MRNVVLIVSLASLFCACSPHSEHPHNTDGITETTGSSASSATDTEGMTGFNPTTEVNGSTGMPDTDDPVITTVPTTGEPPFCPDDAWVMCGNEPCTDTLGNPVCNWNTCEPLPCEDCPANGTCGELFNESVCLLGGLVPCKQPCSPILCSECPDDTCVAAGSSLCLEPDTGGIMCREALLHCEMLLDGCAEDADCATGVSKCLLGHCVAPCEVDADCGLNSLCANNTCVDDEGNMVCSVIPHEPPPPPCEPLNPCLADADCPATTSLCWDFDAMKPVVNGEPGKCIAPCTMDEECASEGSTCSTLGFCIDALDAPTCGV